MLLQTFRVKLLAAKVVVFIGVTKLFPDESSFLNDVCEKIGSAEGWGRGNHRALSINPCTAAARYWHAIAVGQENASRECFKWWFLVDNVRYSPVFWPIRLFFLVWWFNVLSWLFAPCTVWVWFWGAVLYVCAQIPPPKLMGKQGSRKCMDLFKEHFRKICFMRI